MSSPSLPVSSSPPTTPPHPLRSNPLPSSQLSPSMASPQLPPSAHLRPSASAPSFTSTTGLLPRPLASLPPSRLRSFAWVKAFFFTLSILAVIGIGACSVLILLNGRPIDPRLWVGLSWSAIALASGALGSLLVRNHHWQKFWSWIDALCMPRVGGRDRNVPTLYHHRGEVFEMVTGPIHHHQNHQSDLEAGDRARELVQPTLLALAPAAANTLTGSPNFSFPSRQRTVRFDLQPAGSASPNFSFPTRQRTLNLELQAPAPVRVISNQGASSSGSASSSATLPTRSTATSRFAHGTMENGFWEEGLVEPGSSEEVHTRWFGA